MKDIAIEVDWLLFPEDARAVERRLRAHPAVQRANVNPVTGLGVVTFDEAALKVEDIQQIVAECGYHCRGMAIPRFLTTGMAEE